MFDDVLARIMSVYNIDDTNKDARINFDTFVRIKCFLTLNNLGKGELSRIWLKILNPRNLSFCHREELKDLIERMARGKIQPTKTLISEHFADLMMDLFEKEGCFDPLNKDCFMLNVFKEKLEEEVFDVEVFNQIIRPDC